MAYKCPSRKKQFRDRIQAELAIASNRTRRHTRNGSDEIRAYQCNLCPRWHLTSQPRKSREGSNNSNGSNEEPSEPSAE